MHFLEKKYSMFNVYFKISSVLASQNEFILTQLKQNIGMLLKLELINVEVCSYENDTKRI